MREDGGYDREELAEMVRKMRRVADGVYGPLAATGCHPFVEFCGLMQKYVDVCEACVEDEVQFPHATRHSGGVLPVETHDLEYLAEKLGCIFGPLIEANPEARRVFARELLGIEIS
jgi:hypothetical protein